MACQSGVIFSVNEKVKVNYSNLVNCFSCGELRSRLERFETVGSVDVIG